MAVECGAAINIENKQRLTPLTMAAYLARMEMFFHIASIEREIYWQVSPDPGKPGNPSGDLYWHESPDNGNPAYGSFIYKYFNIAGQIETIFNI